MSEAASAANASNQCPLCEKLCGFLFDSQMLLGLSLHGCHKSFPLLANNIASQIAVLEVVEKLPYLVQEDTIVEWFGLKRQWFKAPKARELLEQVMLDTEKCVMHELDLVDFEMAGFLGSDEHYEAARRTIMEGLKVVDLLAHMRLRILAKYSDGGIEIERVSGVAGMVWWKFCNLRRAMYLSFSP
ncbi:hypothetical protein DL95DRAFT_455102 [Leptodontidium sp. 2 PMI_412]|nr:hypothetical protein DL95DRAFT_455102 [Leptodontidium sp. 2 PMI_412]